LGLDAWGWISYDSLTLKGFRIFGPRQSCG
jgi:hypothetical protein